MSVLQLEWKKKNAKLFKSVLYLINISESWLIFSMYNIFKFKSNKILRLQNLSIICFTVYSWTQKEILIFKTGLRFALHAKYLKVSLQSIIYPLLDEKGLWKIDSWTFSASFFSKELAYWKFLGARLQLCSKDNCSWNITIFCRTVYE